MPDFHDNYNASQQYVVTGDLLNRHAREANRRGLIDSASHGSKSFGAQGVPSDNPITSEGQIGIVELITNDWDNVRNSAGDKLDGRDARDQPLTDWEFRNKWYVRFVYMENSIPKVANFYMSLNSSLYAFSDRSNTGVNEGPYGEGRRKEGQMPLFAPGDKIPCIYYPQQASLVPLISPPEEVTYYDIGTGSTYLGQSIYKHRDLADFGEIQARLEFYDPDAKKWYYYRDRIIHMPKKAFGDHPSSFTLSTKMSIMMKDDMQFRIMVAQSQEQDEKEYEVAYWGMNAKMLGRHWRTNPAMFPFQNPNVLYDYLISYEADENRIESTGSWTQLGGQKGIANTKRRFRDTPDIKNVGGNMTFGIEKPRDIRWNWTAEVTFQITIASSDLASSQSHSTSSANESSASFSLSESSRGNSSSSTVDNTSSYSGSLSFSSSESTEYRSTSSTVAFTTSSTARFTTSSTQAMSSSQLGTTSSTQAQTTSSTAAFTTSSTGRFSTSGTGSSSTAIWCCVTVVSDIRCNDDGTIAEVCKTRICWPRYTTGVVTDVHGVIKSVGVTDGCKIFPEACSPCGGAGTTSGTSQGGTTSSSQSASSISSVSSSTILQESSTSLGKSSQSFSTSSSSIMKGSRFSCTDGFGRPIKCVEVEE